VLVWTAARDDPGKCLDDPNLCRQAGEESVKGAEIPMLHMLGVIAQAAEVFAAQHIAEAEPGFEGY
jgi:hypothetical protein